MRTLMLMLTTALLSLPALAQDDGPVRVFILAGQSNMEGQGVVEMDHPEHYNGGLGNLVWSMQHSQSAAQMAHLRDAEGHWVQRRDVAIWYRSLREVERGGEARFGPLTVGYTGYGGSSHIGPELQFGRVVGDALDSDVLLIKTAWGGKSLFVDFRPPSAGGQTGESYSLMVSDVREALEALGDRPYQIAGFIWMQGWNDMIDEAATAQYADNLVHLAGDLRAEFGVPSMPIVVGELGNGGEADPQSGMGRFREAQRAGTARIENAVFVQTHLFARPAELSPNPGHGHHWFGNAESYFLVGDALGRAAVQMITGADPQSDADAQAGPAIDTALLIADWSHACESEQPGDASIFRLTNSQPFGPSRFRMRYNFRDDHTCQWLYLDPADAHRMVSGTWRVDENDPTRVLIFNSEGQRQSASFQIVELSLGLLRTRPIPADN